MRVLVVDESNVLSWLVGRLGGAGVEVCTADSFDSALDRVRRDPPAAAIVSLTGAHLPWRDFQHLCATRDPWVPVLYASCVGMGPYELGLSPLEGWAAFLPKPASRLQLEAAIRGLLAAAGARREAPVVTVGE
jgi:DNA-binding NtrC family response regulator